MKHPTVRTLCKIEYKYLHNHATFVDIFSGCDSWLPLNWRRIKLKASRTWTEH